MRLLGVVAGSSSLLLLLHYSTTPVAAAATCSAVLTDTDYPGNDIKQVSGKAVTDCCQLCQDTAGCGAFSWSSWNSGTCFLKSKAGTAATASGVKSATLVTDSGGCTAIEENTDYPGNDIKSYSGKAIEECCALCQQTSTCALYSWSSYNSGTCWLKSSGGTAKTVSGVRSAKIKTTTNCPTIEENVDYVNNDLKSVSGKAKASDCCQVCRDTAGCGAFSWNNYNGGTCWLKTAKGTTKTAAGVYSAVISTVITTSPPSTEPCQGQCNRGNIGVWATYPNTPACWQNEGSYYSCFEKVNGACPWGGMTDCTQLVNPTALCRGGCLKNNLLSDGWVSSYATNSPPCWKNEGTYYSCYDYGADGKCATNKGNLTDCRAQDFGSCYFSCGSYCFNPNHWVCCFDTGPSHGYTWYWMWGTDGQQNLTGCAKNWLRVWIP